MGRGGRKSRPYNWVAEGRSRPHWYTVSDMGGRVVRHEKIAAGADLRALLVRALSEWTKDGWQVEEFRSDSSSFFCNKDGDRRMIQISPTDPETGPPVSNLMS